MVSPGGPTRYRGAARGLRIAALGVSGLATAFWLWFAIGEVARGELGGLSHLAPVAAMALLAALALRRPAVGAVAFLAAGAAWSLYVRDLLGAALLGAPFFLIGLLLGAAWLVRRGRRVPRGEEAT